MASLKPMIGKKTIYINEGILIVIMFYIIKLTSTLIAFLENSLFAVSLVTNIPFSISTWQVCEGMIDAF